MSEEEAVERALAALFQPGSQISSRPIRSIRYDAVSKRDPRPGWVIVLPLDVPEGFEPDEVFVEVYEPDGEVFIPKII